LRSKEAWGFRSINLENLKKHWEAYNGFALISIVLGIVCLCIPWFRRAVYILTEFSHYEYKFFFSFITWDLKTALFALLYLLGLTFLIFYYTGIVLRNHGKYDTPMENHAQLFFKIGIILLTSFQVLIFLHFINPPNLPWFSFFYNILFYNNWKIFVGFILGSIMLGLVIVSFLYERLALRQDYQNHLPEHLPQSTNRILELEALIS
jgi:hypothetical protein